MLYDMSTFQPDMEALAVDGEDYSTHLLRERSCPAAIQAAQHGYRDIDSGVPDELSTVDIDSFLDAVENDGF